MGILTLRKESCFSSSVVYTNKQKKELSSEETSTFALWEIPQLLRASS